MEDRSTKRFVYLLKQEMIEDGSTRVKGIFLSFEKAKKVAKKDMTIGKKYKYKVIKVKN